MLASEGTLGIFTKIILKLLPLPKAQVDLLCLFNTTYNAIDSVHKIITGTGIIPTSIEFMDRECLNIAFKYLNESIPIHNAGGSLLISIDAPSTEQAEKDYATVCDFLELQNGLIEIYVADNPSTSERVWKIRINLGEASALISKNQTSEDLVVPPASIYKISQYFKKLSKKYNVRIPCFGHAGDGNLHTRIIAPDSWTKDKWENTISLLLDELYNYTAKLGGRISGEHGIGHKKKKYMPLVVSDSYINVLKSIKKALDPNNIMNPGKIFDI
jgi:glycolate oxidase